MLWSTPWHWLQLASRMGRMSRAKSRSRSAEGEGPGPLIRAMEFKQLRTSRSLQFRNRKTCAQRMLLASILGVAPVYQPGGKIVEGRVSPGRGVL